GDRTLAGARFRDCSQSRRAVPEPTVSKSVVPGGNGEAALRRAGIARFRNTLSGSLGTGLRRPPPRNIWTAPACTAHRFLGSAPAGGEDRLGGFRPSGAALVFRQRRAISHACGRLRGACSGNGSSSSGG